MPTSRPIAGPALTLAIVSLAAGCGGEGAPPPMADRDTSRLDAPTPLELLADGAAIFGLAAGATTPEHGAEMAARRNADFIVYTMEGGAFDMNTMRAYMDGMASGAMEIGMPAQPVWLRMPPIGEDGEGGGADVVEARVAEARAAGVAGLMFANVTTGAEAAAAVEAVGEPWPLGDDGADVLMVGDREGVAHVREIMATPGVSVVFAGPDDLRRAYDGDEKATENAVQTILSACLEFEVVCGVTAGSDDITRRLDAGFRAVVATDADALALGRKHVGR